MAKKSKSNFPNNLDKVRVRAGLSQMVVAGKLGLTQPSYSNLEAGKSRLTVDRAKKLARILSCQMWELSDDFLTEPLTQGRGRAGSNPGTRHFQESSRVESASTGPQRHTDKMIAEVAAMDPVLRIVMEQSGKAKSKFPSDVLLLVYAAVSRHVSDFEQHQNMAASDDYMRGVVAAKLEQFTRRTKP